MVRVALSAPGHDGGSDTVQLAAHLVSARYERCAVTGPGYHRHVTVRIHNITVDCAHPTALARWWTEVTGWEEDPENPNLPEDEEAALIAPDQSMNLLFVKVPESKVVKNRVHLDVQPTHATRDDEVARLLELGAAVVADRRRPDGSGWVVLADPEGNEFCVERSAAERAGTS